MEVESFIIPKTDNRGLVYQVDEGSSFYGRLHRHEEIQLTVLVKGRGGLVIGDTIQHFEEGDFIAIGSGIPHLFRSSEECHYVKMISIFFTPRSFGDQFFELDETSELIPVFDDLKHGFKLAKNHDFVEEFEKMASESGILRLNRFLNLMHLLGESERERLASFVFARPFGENEGSRMQRVMEMAITSYSKAIRLEDVAELANMTSNAFCRYFKQRTNKTFFQFLQEIRISQACRMLSEENDYSISEIADQTGFQNLSNFNRSFKKIKGLTPGEYKRNYRQRL